MRRCGEGFALGEDRAPDDAGVGQHRLLEHALEQSRQVGVMLDGVELWQLVHGVVLLHVLRLRFDTEPVQIGDRVCKRRIGLDPTGSARDLEDLHAQILDDCSREQTADEQIAVPVHPPTQFGAILQEIS